MTTNHTFSLVVNTIDRAAPLQTLLLALDNQAYPHFEVIVVVGPTKDHTLEMLAAFNGRLRLLRCPTANLSQSRNIGLLAARGDIVAFIDDDAVPSHHWLTQLNRLFADPLLVGTGGKVYRIHPDKPIVQHHIGTASGLAEQVDVRTSWLDAIIPPGTGRQWHGRMMGTNMVFRRQELITAGGFDEFYQWVYDDTDVALHLVNQGKLVHPVKETVVYHIPASSRNRTVNTSVGNWWIQTKAAFYFSLKNGASGGNRRADIFRRCLHLWHGHLLWYSYLRRQNLITPRQHWQMRLQEARGALSGSYYGLLPSAKRLPPASMTASSTDPITPFQNEDSALQPTVDPISGRRPEITLTEPPLRICLLSMSYPPHQYEGVGRHTHLMAQGLFELGHQVHVITRGQGDAVSFYDGAYVHQTPYDRRRYGRYRLFPRLHNTLNYSHAVYEQVRRLQLNDGIQVVDSPLWGLDGLVTAVSGDIPLVLRLQTAVKQIASLQQNSDTDSRLLGDMEQNFIHQATHLVPNSQATVNAMQKVYNTAPQPERMTIIPHGIVPVAEEEIRPFNHQHPPATLTVLYVGRLEKRKGIRDLYAAIPQVAQRLPHVRFIIVGADNSRQDGFLAQHGADYATIFHKQHPELAQRVHFTGAVSEEELYQQYQNCDLFVAPSLYESFGLIYLEAMNYAKPTIGCRAGGIPEVVEHGVTGLLVEPEAPTALAEAMLTLLQSPQKLYEMGLAGRQRLLQYFTHIEMARQFTAVYRQVTRD
ncbi:MAG: glycosyltransferase [Ardenticatenaceae bacterium]|nr:glycosyltransferase [Ardenticatenaceae bacterium]